MMGIIKKDMLMIKNNLKLIITALIIFVFYTIMFDMDMSFFLPFETLMISLSTFNYDDLNNWHSFASALPNGKINNVKSKYITSISLIIIATTISIIFNYIIGSSKGTINIAESLSSIMGGLLAIIFLMSVLFPVLFKYGAEKGRIAMIILGIAIMGGVILLTKVIQIDILNDLIAFLDSYFLIIFVTTSFIMISISYAISKKIYLKREF